MQTLDKTKIKHIFFDLDNTLWDFDANSQQVLHELIKEFHLIEKCKCTAASFIKTYVLVNDDLWALYRKHAITKEELRSSRFTNTMLYFGYEDKELGMNLEKEYISRSPYRKELVPYTIEILDYLNSKYKLHIITNGFKEVQHIKLSNCGLEHYFEQIIISEEVGVNKPNEKIYHHALEKANTSVLESVMIGDDWDADIIGTYQLKMPSIYFNRNKKGLNNNLVPEIHSLKELSELL